MAVKLRLMRTGKTKQPSYRVIAKEARTPRSGKYIELLGTYNPLTNPETVNLNKERIAHWLSVGAQPTETVARLIKKYGSADSPTVAEPTQTKSEKKAAAAPPKPAPVVEAPAAGAEAPAAAAEETAAVATEETAAVATEETAAVAVEETAAGDTTPEAATEA
jgi:small subunit ribosomal protein S16